MRLKNSLLKYFIFLSFIIFTLLPAQDLEPRRWNPLPSGSTILGINYGHISGDIGFDPVLEIEDTKVKRDFLLISYTRFFLFSEKLMRFDLFLPFHNAKWNGLLSGERNTVERTGIGNPILRLSVNLLDSGSDVSNGSKNVIKTVVGAGIAVGVPLGEYFEDRLLNLGTNRYMIRPQLGVVHIRGPWSYELTGSIFYFTDNDNFLSGGELQQKPFYSLQTHVIRTFEAGIWASLSAGYGQGGALKVNGVNKDDRREGFIGALSFGLPITDNQTLKFAYIWTKTQTDTEVRSKLTTVTAGWSFHF